MDAELKQRLHRIYASAEEAFSIDPAKVQRTFAEEREGCLCAGIAFGDALAEEQKSNQVHTVICNVAHLRDDLKRKARALGYETSEVDDVINRSAALQIVLDLSNRDKHRPGRDGGFSGKHPELLDLSIAFIGGWRKGDKGFLEIAFRPGSEQEIFVGGTGHFEIVGKVVDGAGQTISGAASRRL